MGGHAGASSLKPDHDEPRLLLKAQRGVGLPHHAEGGGTPHCGEVPQKPRDRSRPAFDLELGCPFAAGVIMGLAGILVSLGLLIWLAYRGWSVLVLAPAAALLAAAIAREPLLAHWTQTF